MWRPPVERIRLGSRDQARAELRPEVRDTNTCFSLFSSALLRLLFTGTVRRGKHTAEGILLFLYCVLRISSPLLRYLPAVETSNNNKKKTY